MSVFAGGWTLEAAEQVCGGVVGEELSVLRGLTELVEANLVRTTEADGQVRYSMHRVTREYAAERLAATPELADVERRHAEWVRELVETAEPHLVLRDLRAWQDRLKVEEDNLRRALRWTIDHQETDLGLLIGGACWRFWFHWATMREGVAWLEELLALPGAQTWAWPRARALSSLAGLWWHQGRFDTLDAYLEVVDILRSLGIDDERLGDALDDAAWGAMLTGDPALKVRLTEEKWRYPRRPRTHMWDGWISREVDLAWGRLVPGMSPV